MKIITPKEVYDWELVMLVREGSNLAFDALVNRYSELGLKLIRHYRHQKNTFHYSVEDLWALYLEALYNAAMYYRLIVVTFKTYFLKVFNRILNNFFNHCYLKDNLTIEQLHINNTCKEVLDLYEVIEDKNAVDPRVALNANEANLCLSSDKKYSKLGEEQRKIILLKIKGYTLKEIAEELNMDISKVRRVLSKDEEKTPISEMKKCLGVTK